VYELADYLSMVEDPVRTPAYLEAMRAVIRRDDQVLELGTGFGYFAVQACRLGAAHVWAVEPNDAIAHGRALADANGCGDRITFIQDVSERITLPRRADVLLEDLRGVSPLHGRRLHALADAHRRLLMPAARSIPLRDHLRCAPTEWPGDLRAHPGDVDADLHGVRVDAVRRAALHGVVPARPGSDALLAPGMTWASLELGGALDPDAPIEGEARFTIGRRGRFAAIASWFATELSPGVGFDTAPGGPRTVYDRAVLALDEPVPVEEGDHVTIRIRAVSDGGDYVWAWSARVDRADGSRVDRAGSSLGSRLLSAARRRRRAEGFIPPVTPGIERMRTLYEAVDGARPLATIAEALRARHPQHFADERAALAWAGERLAEVDEPRAT
jgi:hypothetical protein